MVADIMSPDVFFDPVHARVYDAIRTKVDLGHLASPVTIKSMMEADEGLQDLGGGKYLVRLFAAAASTFAVRDYARMIVDHHGKRRLMEHMRDTAERIRIGKQPVAELAVQLESNVGALAASSSIKPMIRSYMNAMGKAIEKINRTYQGEIEPGLSTGLPQLDLKLGFLRPGTFTLLAGRPSMGKTTAAQNIVYAASKAGIGSFYGSLEMSGEEMTPRFLSRGLRDLDINLAYEKMQRGDLTEMQMRQVIDEGRRQQDFPMFLGERDVRDLSKMRSAIRRTKQRFEDADIPFGLIVIDYLQLLDDPRYVRAIDRVSAASDFCKSMAMEMDVPVVALSQLNRGVESREPPVPMMSDLRESGRLEEDADAVVFTYRDAYYTSKKLDATDTDNLDEINELRLMLSRNHDKIDYIVSKNRGGATGTVTAYCNMATCHIYSERIPTPGESFL